MKRKVIQIAESTQLVSLPRKWALKNGIKKGDELDVTIVNNRLMISTENEHIHSKTKIDLSDYPKTLIRWTILSLHKSGYDEIEVLFNQNKQLKYVQEIIKEGNLLGFEIMEQGERRCLIKVISKGLEEEFDPILRRAFLVTLSMANSSLDIIRRGNYPELADVLILEETNNKMTNFCHRILLNNKGFSKIDKTVFTYLIVWQLENIADNYRYLANDLMHSEPGPKEKKELGKPVIKFFKETNDLVKEFYELFYKFDRDQMIKAIETIKEMNAVAKNLLKKGTLAERLTTHHLSNIVQLTRDILPSVNALKFEPETVIEN